MHASPGLLAGVKQSCCGIDPSSRQGFSLSAICFSWIFPFHHFWFLLHANSLNACYDSKLLQSSNFFWKQIASTVLFWKSLLLLSANFFAEDVSSLITKVAYVGSSLRNDSEWNLICLWTLGWGVRIAWRSWKSEETRNTVIIAAVQLSQYFLILGSTCKLEI